MRTVPQDVPKRPHGLFRARSQYSFPRSPLVTPVPGSELQGLVVACKCMPIRKMPRIAYSSRALLTISQLMALWREDFSTCTLEEVLGWRAENRAWSKDLRRKTNSLVNSRLANDISQADYLENRKLGHEDAAECRRRATILEAQIMRTVSSLPRES